MQAIDSDILSLLINPSATVPKDPATGEPVTRAAERVNHLIDTLETDRTKLLIASPVLSEILILAEESGVNFLDEFESCSGQVIPDTLLRVFS